jgi:hypothetical protein
MTDQQCIKKIADEFGDWHRPSWYIKQVKRKFGRDVSNSSVTKSIGPRADRVTYKNTRKLRDVAADFLQLCNQDYHFALHILKRVRSES